MFNEEIRIKKNHCLSYKSFCSLRISKFILILMAPSLGTNTVIMRVHYIYTNMTDFLTVNVPILKQEQGDLTMKCHNKSTASNANIVSLIRLQL